MILLIEGLLLLAVKEKELKEKHIKIVKELKEIVKELKENHIDVVIELKKCKNKLCKSLILYLVTFFILYTYIYIYIMNRLDDTFQSELLETLTIMHMRAGLLYQATTAGEDTTVAKKELQATKEEALNMMKEIKEKYNYIPKDVLVNAIVNLVAGNLEPQDVIDLINAKIDGTISARGKRKRIKRNSKRIKRNSKRIKRKSHRRSYRNKKM